MKWLMRLLGLEPRNQELAAPEAPPIQERRAQPDPEALKAASKPSNHRPGLDLERLKSLPSARYQPLTEYLSYIQVKRGESESLVFVRESDIDALAKMTGESRENFVKEFKRLGVLISMN
jgi:hypothetical protein